MAFNIKALGAQVDDLRGRISAASEVVANLADPFPPASEIKARAEIEVNAIRDEALARINLGACGASHENYRAGRAAEWLARLSGAELLAVMNPKSLVDLLAKEGEAEASAADPAFRLSAIEAKAALAAKEVELVMLEATEESLIRQSEAEGINIQRRASAMPAVVLAPDSEIEAFLAQGKAA
ncbi:MAG: hypothetical protein O9342_14630 [Beijerinckiaceae bacterium]|nr:hypothetical protein [Beijerinckiaceae bacterium]